MKSNYLSALILLVISHSCYAQEKRSFIDWLSGSGTYKNISWIKNAAFRIDNNQAVYSDAEAIKFDAIGKIEIYSKKQAINTFGKEEGNKGVIVIETIKLSKRDDIITLNDSVKYYLEASDTVYTTTEQKGMFSGGKDQWIKYLQRNLNADITVENGAPSGIYTTIIAFTINTDGSISDAKIAYDPGYGTGKESLRIIQKSNSLWQPSIHNGIPVKSVLMQAITYQIAEG